MDKISFLLKIDFEKIPVLKQALIDSGIWEVKLMLERLSTEDKLEEEIQIDKENGLIRITKGAEMGAKRGSYQK